MKFREMAIQAHCKAEQEAKAWRQDQAIGFADRAASVFKRSIAKVEILSSPIEPRLALLLVDGINIQAREECGGIEFYIHALCDCGVRTYTHTPTLADIGKALENGPSACKNCDI